MDNQGKSTIFYLPFKEENCFGERTLSIGGWGKFQCESRKLTEIECALLAGLLLNFLNKEGEFKDGTL